jgi:large conductance mechanosensitive channel
MESPSDGNRGHGNGERDRPLHRTRPGGIIGAVISFLITAAVVFFVIVKPVNKLMSMMKKEEAAAPPAPPADILLLTEIRDLLKK